MRPVLGGCAVIVLGILIAIALYWGLSTRLGTGDDGPTGHTLTTTRSNA